MLFSQNIENLLTSLERIHSPDLISPCFHYVALLMIVTRVHLHIDSMKQRDLLRFGTEAVHFQGTPASCVDSGTHICSQGACSGRFRWMQFVVFLPTVGQGPGGE